MKDPRISFDSNLTDEEAKQSLNKGLKLKPSKSSLAKKQVAENFNQRVSETHKRLEGNLKSAYELATEFTRLMADSRIEDNVGPIDKSFEKEIIRKLINYAIQVNSDENEQEGMGSVSLITLLLKTLFKMRNKMNQMAYNNHMLEIRLTNIEKSIASSPADTANETK
jgi:hypothetical protein